MTALGQRVNLYVAWEKPAEAEKWRVLLPKEPVKQVSRSLGGWHKRLGLKACVIGMQSSSLGDRRSIGGGLKLAVGHPERCVGGAKWPLGETQRLVGESRMAVGEADAAC